jgi:hypothetical protein
MPRTQRFDVDLMLRLSGDTHAYLRTHSFRRDVTEQELIRDIVNSWIRRATPHNDPIFSVASVGYSLPPAPTNDEKYPGYVESLRFLPEIESQVDGTEPPPRTRREQWPELP